MTENEIEAALARLSAPISLRECLTPGGRGEWTDVETVCAAARAHLSALAASPPAPAVAEEGVTLVNALERIAFSITPPNAWTPEILQCCIALRHAIVDLREENARLRDRVALLEKLDSEAATYVESVICHRTDFAEIDPDEKGWKGLGDALNRALDARDRAEADANRLASVIRLVDNDGYISPYDLTNDLSTFIKVRHLKALLAALAEHDKGAAK